MMQSGTEPGVIVHSQQGGGRRSSRAHRASSAATRGLISGRRSTLHGANGAHNNDDDGEGFDLDRLSYMSTALAALPGMSLRKYFVPVMRLFRQRLAERRATRARFADGEPIDMTSRAIAKQVQDGMQNLAKALTEASREVGAADGRTLSVDPKALAELLDGKVEPVSVLANHVLTYPSESPESQFVYILLSGSVNVTYYQPQSHRVSAPLMGAGGGGGVGGAAGDARTQFFTSSDEKIFLCGGGINVDGNNLFLAAAQAHEARQNNGNGANNAAGFNDTGSNMTSAIQRSLRNASRAVGQPTLVAGRSEVVRAPAVLGAAEALGLAPFKCATVAAATTSQGKGEVTQYVPYVDVLRVRLLDVHAAVLQLCVGPRGVWPAAMTTTTATGGRQSLRLSESADNALVVSAARSKTLASYYYQNEIAMRQSWLLQDTPTGAIRSLVALLRPRTFMPGEVLACPHRHSAADRQLCFLRRGRARVVEVPKTYAQSCSRGASPAPGGHESTGRPTAQRRVTTTAAPHGACPCVVELATAAAAAAAAAATPAGGNMYGSGGALGEDGLQTVGVAEAGTSFGELSLLFGEPRSLTLVADTACDVWCLSYADFAVCMRRDDALRRSLIDKAAALRMKWLGEQRFTSGLAQQLRDSCELFRPLSDYVIRLIQERLEPVVYSPGSIVTSTSEKCDGLIIVIHGRVVSIIDGVASYGPGDTIGEGCLVAHRWPLGLSARSMVEGWKLKREALQAALEKADMLHAHSGETTSMTPLWLKRIFAPPLPEVETDIVGRQRMPTVGPAPGGEGYPRYGRIMSEVFLKALCFRYRDYVRWEDICYDTLGSPQGLVAQQLSDQLSRELVMSQMQTSLATARGESRPATAPLASRLHAPAPPASAGRTRAGRVGGGGGGGGRPAMGADGAPLAAPSGRRRGTLSDVHAAQAAAAAGEGAGDANGTTTTTTGRPGSAHAAGAGRDAAKKARQSNRSALTNSAHPNADQSAAVGSRKSGRGAARNKHTAGASAFLVNNDVISDPFRPLQGVVMSLARGSAPKARSARRASTVSDVDGTNATGGVATTAPEGLMSPAASSRWQRTLEQMQQPLPQLDAFSGVLGSRDRLYNTERQQDMTAEQQQAQREAQVRERLQALKASSAAAAGGSSGGAHRVKRVTSSESGVFQLATARSAIATADATPAAPPLPPVHLFLSDPDNPRAELTVAEAIAIGYVLQLPDKDHIQSSVSVVDPDVTLGLPSHRARRRTMALTPNDRHSRHNFLFAAASFVDASESVSRYHERKGQEQERQAKARRLLDMLQVADDWHARRRGHKKAKPNHNDSSNNGEVDSDDDAMMIAAAGSAFEPFASETEPAAVAPGTRAATTYRRDNPSIDRETSPTVLTAQISSGFFSPERDPGSGTSTPSPFRGSPGKAAQKREEGYMRLLSRDPVKAMDLLYHRYNLSWGGKSSTSTAGSPMGRGSFARGPAPPQYSRNNSSAWGAGGKPAGLTERLRAATQPTAEPMPGLNFDQPELVFASGRDRRACAAYLSVRSGGGHVAADLTGAGSPTAMMIPSPPRTPSQRVAGMRLATPVTSALETATCAIDAAVHAPEAALFVDGYGTLKPEPAPVLNHTLWTLPLDPLDTLPTAYSFGQPRGSVADVSRYSYRAGGGDATGTGSAISPGASMFSHAVPRPQDLVMPDPEEAGQFMRRMQRDVVGLNAIAEEQARERERQRTQEPRLARRAERVAAEFSHPTEDEDQVVRAWHDAYHVQIRDPLAVVRVPDALLPEAGANHLAREMARYERGGGGAGAGQGSSGGGAASAHANVVAWQDQVSGPSVSPHEQSHGAGSGRRTSGPGARRVVAAIGTKQLGYPSIPLVSPTQKLSEDDYREWKSEREQFFAAYAQQQRQQGRGSVFDQTALDALREPTMNVPS